MGLDRLFHVGIVEQFEFGVRAEIAVLDHMDGRVRDRLDIVLQQFQAVALPIDDPEGHKIPVQLFERFAERRPIGGDALIVAGRGIDHDRRVPVLVADVDEADPAIAVIKIDELAIDLRAIGLEHVRIGGVGVDEENLLLRLGQEMGHGHRDQRLSDPALAAAYDIDGFVHRRSP